MFRLGETFGIEIEYCDVVLQPFPPSIKKYFTLTHDASVETNNVLNLKGIPVNARGELQRYFRSSTMGKEIISRVPLEIDDSFEIINSLTSFLKESGVSSKNDRAGIHIHITCSPNYSIIREIFNVGLNLEAALYYFGCMGNSFRGTKNNCSYCFPLSRPPIIRNNLYLYSIEDVFNAKTYNQIIERAGDLYHLNNSRYAPPRYAYLNYYSLLLRGSLEFRVFNLTLSPFVIDLTLKLCSHITKEIIRRSFDSKFKMLPPNPITSTTKEEAIDSMELFLEQTGFDDIDSVLLLMEKSSDIIINPNPVFTHLMYHPSRGNICPSMYRTGGYKPPKVKNPNDVIVPVTAQSHNTRFENKQFPIDFVLNKNYKIKPKKLYGFNYMIGERRGRRSVPKPIRRRTVEFTNTVANDQWTIPTNIAERAQETLNRFDPDSNAGFSIDEIQFIADHLDTINDYFEIDLSLEEMANELSRGAFTEVVEFIRSI
jgi:hypothetical protein